MDVYTGVVYPLVLGTCAALALLGIVTLIWVRAHMVLTWVVTAMWIVTAVQIVTIIVVLLSGNAASLVLTIGYLLAAAAVLPLLGIGRLGEPDSAKLDPDPLRPVLQPDQIARVDAGAAIVIAIAAAALAWRLYEILVAAA